MKEENSVFKAVIEKIEQVNPVIFMISSSMKKFGAYLKSKKQTEKVEEEGYYRTSVSNDRILPSQIKRDPSKINYQKDYWIPESEDLKEVDLSFDTHVERSLDHGTFKEETYNSLKIKTFEDFFQSAPSVQNPPNLQDLKNSIVIKVEQEVKSPFLEFVCYSKIDGQPIYKYTGNNFLQDVKFPYEELVSVEDSDYSISSQAQLDKAMKYSGYTQNMNMLFE
jgi:hypothetical protein